MNDFKRISNSTLIDQTKSLVREELRIGLEVLKHLREIERRRLFLERGHASLFVFCLNELGYSQPQAQHRIDAMRALRDTPGIESKIRSGELSVTSVVKVQRFLRKEKTHQSKTYSNTERLELFQQVAGLSAKDVERKLVQISPESALPLERERMIAKGKIELKLIIGSELHEQLEALKALYSHQMKDPGSTTELLKLLAHLGFKQAAKKTGGQLVTDADFKINYSVDQRGVSKEGKVSKAGKVNKENRLIQSGLQHRQSRYIPAAIRRLVWEKARAQCAFQDPHTKRRCQSRHYLQIEHIRPYALGGSSTDSENLTLLCGAHNRFRAIKVFGERKFKKD